MKISKKLVQLVAVGAVLTLALRLRSDKPAGAGSAPDGEGQDDALAELDAYLDRQLGSLNVPGAALAVVEGDEIVHLRAFGRARPRGEAPSPQTPFVLGSLTKSFTALAVMQLVEDGQVELDDPVQAYLPWFEVADPKASARMTVRHLLNQTSGLPQMPGMLNLADFDSRPDATERQMRALSTLKLPRPVGSAFEYSNLNYNLLGLIVEAASGESYADYVQSHIFEPLKMRHSYTSQAAAQQDGLAVGHRYWFGTPLAAPDLPLPGGSLPSGQLIASAEDMGHYLIAHLNGGRYGGAQILSSAGVDELHRPAADATTMGIALGDYAMGWLSLRAGEERIVWHSGTLPDFFSYMALVPEKKRALVLLVNANHVVLDKMVLTEVGMGAAKRLAGEPAEALRLGAVPWLLRGTLLIPVLQLAGVLITLRSVRHWRREPDRRPRRRWLHATLPALPNLALGLGALGLLGSGTLKFMLLFMPDLTWLVLLSGGFGLAWGALRTWLVASALEEPSGQRV
jgi:CubicO group peptidase (beta-lactamase class C family)